MLQTTGDGDPAALRAAVSKANWRIIPLLGLCYLIAYMDRVNISFAATQMNDALGFSATIYGIGGGLFFLSYALFEVPSNMLMLRVGPRRWIARIMITWGILAAGMMFVRTPLQFYIVRFLIGVAEAGFFPCAVYYLSSWFPRAERGRAISRFYLFGPLAGAVMGVVSGWLLALDGLHGLAGWQWLLLVEGLPAVAVGVIVLFCLPDSPAQSRWLVPRERQALAAALAGDARLTARLPARLIDSPPPHDLRAILARPVVRLLALNGFLTIGVFYPFTLFAPKILMLETGLNVQSVGWLVTAGGLIGAGTMVLAGWIMDRSGNRFPTLLLAIVGEGLGLAGIALAAGPGSVIAAYVLFSASWAAVTLAQVAIWADVLRERELAIGSAFINSVSQIGAFVAPIGFGALIDRTGGYRTGLSVLPVAMIALLGLTLVLRQMIQPRPAIRAALV